MAGRRRIEDHVVECTRRIGVPKELRKLIERRDFDRARTRQLLLDARHGGSRQHPAIGADDTVAIRACGFLWIDVQGGEPWYARHRFRGRIKCDLENFVQVRCRIGRHEQHAFAGVCQTNRGRAGQRGLSNASLACEEQDARRDK